MDALVLVDAAVKPHLHMLGGLWWCATPDGRRGAGHTPAEAYGWWEIAGRVMLAACGVSEAALTQ